MKSHLRKKLTWLALSLIFLGVYYGFLFDIALATKNSLVDTMVHNNMTEIYFDVREYNATTDEWVRRPTSINLVGLVDFILTIIIIFAPIVLVMKVVIP